MQKTTLPVTIQITKRFWVMLLLLSQFYLNAVQAQQENSWDDPEFRKHFMASYGFDGPREPSIDGEEQVLLRQIASQMEHEQYDTAIQLLRAHISPSSSAALDYTLGNLYYQRNDMAAAEAAYLSALQKSPNFVRASRNLAHVYVNQNDFHQAEEQLQKAIQNGGGDGPSFGLLAYIYLQNQNYAAANEAYEEALMYTPDRINWQMGKLQALSALKHYQEVIDHINRLRQEMPDSKMLWLLQANAYLALDQKQEAAVNLEYLRRRGLASASDKILLGNIYQNQGLLSMANEIYLEALTEPDKPLFSELLQASQMLTNRNATEQLSTLLPAMENAYEGQLQLKETNDLRGLQAQLALQRGDSETAANIVRQVLEKEPFNGQALLILARYEGENGHIEEAELLYQRTTRIPELKTQAYIANARMQVAHKRYAKAYALLEKAQQVQPQAHIKTYMEHLKPLVEQ